MNIGERFQHGDVILVRIAGLSEGGKEIDVKPGFVVEKGEGLHTHVLQTAEGVKAQLTVDGFLEMMFSKPTVLDHEEHKGKIIPPGTYRKEIENEYDAETDEARKTQD